MRTAALGLVGLALGGAGLACQSYNMEGVDPQTVIAVETSETFTAAKPPALLVVQDRSGSMNRCFGSDEGGGEQCDTTGRGDYQDGTSRMHIAQRVMQDAVGTHGADVLFGLVLYGVDEDDVGCGLPEAIATPSLDAAGTVIEAYEDHPALVQPRGGTPTTVALHEAREMLLDAEGALRMPERANYVVLVTDGLMNCNHDHAMPCVCSQENGCPLLGGGEAAFGETGEFGQGGRSLPSLCLDDDASIRAVEELRNAGVKTFVIGLGESFAGSTGQIGIETLNELAVAGGMPRDGEEKFYSAANEQDLETALAEIIDAIQVPCQYELDGPVCDGRLLHVTMQVDGVEVPTVCDPDGGEESWRFVDERTIAFSDDLCRRFEQAQDVRISIKGVETGCETDESGAIIGPACDLRDLLP